MTTKTKRIGDVVCLDGRRGKVDCVVVGTRMIRRGRNKGRVEYQLAPMIASGRTFGYTVIGERLLKAPMGHWTKDVVQNAIDAHAITQTKEDARKESRVERRMELAANLGEVKAGDEVLVNYSNAQPTWETVAKPVNPRNGKVGIVRPGAAEWNQMLDESEGPVRCYDEKLRPVKTARRREVRWIPASVILRVRKPREVAAAVENTLARAGRC